MIQEGALEAKTLTGKETQLLSPIYTRHCLHTLEEPRTLGKAVGSFLQKQAMHNDGHSYKHVGKTNDLSLKWNLEYGLGH